jgi:cytochrome c553
VTEAHRIHAVTGWWRPLALGFAAATVFSASALPQDLSLDERIEQCKACHGADGNSRTEKIPSLAGQPEFFLLNQLILMREGVRRIEAMAPFVKNLTDKDATALAKHFAALAPKRTDEAIDPALVKRGAEIAAQRRCASCHLPSLAGQDQMPRLAGQRIDYMIDSLKAYRDDKRSGADTAMTAVILGLSDADLAALAHYSASR